MRISQKLSLSIVVAGVVACVFATSAVALPSEHPFELVPGSFHFAPSGGQAGAHDDWVTSFDFAHEASGQTYNDVRNIVVNLPAGFVGNNTAVPTCSDAQLLASGGIEGEIPECPVASQVGQISLSLNDSSQGLITTVVPVYNMEVTSFGVAAVLAFKTIAFTTLLSIGVRPGDDGLTVTTPNITRFAEPKDISFTTWGLPAAHEHDTQRGEVCEEGHCEEEFGGPVGANIPVRPFLSNPTSCGPFTASIEAYSWEDPLAPVSASAETPAVTGCERVPFEPSVEVQPTTRSAESPTGLDVSLVVPQSYENPFSLATANLRNTRVTLPEGITINPSAGSGLGSCTPEQYESETSSSPPGAGCPPESKIGSIEIETPVLAEKINGAVYVATPYDNNPEFGSPEHPGGSLLALYIVAKNAQRGIVIKTAGKVELNPVTGQLTTTFENTPQQPFTRFTLKFRPGATAPLVSPPVCGSYAAQAALTPWSAPSEPRLLSSTPFETSEGVNEGPCPSGGIPPFHPGLTAGTLNNSAGSYSSMDIHITRQDGEQEITGFSSQLPAGLTANLTGVPFCTEADIALARSKTGAQEETEPACPAASEIGHTLVGAGVGTVLAYTPGKVFLAGPFEGAPFSIAAITSAKVGPFDLGTVVVHLPLFINPETAAVSIPSGAADQIPHIIDGIVIHVRDIRVYIERPSFMLNPTSCDPTSFASTVIGGGANPTNPADNTPVTTNDSFQLANCQNLKFEPKFQVSTSGKTSKANGASLTAKLTYPTGALGQDANIKEVKVDLPKQLPSRLTTLQKACTAAQFNTNPAGCPTASNIGYAKAITPILPVPLEGPVYFVSHGGEAFPSLEIVLQGYGVKITLVASTFISKAGITSSTFHTVPDQPVTSFEITLPEGKYSALAANGNLCTAKLAMPTAFVAQNGAEIHQTTPISVSGCPKVKKTLTRAQKLAKALKACKQKKSKGTRAKCEKTARTHYGPVKNEGKKK
jgi:hypothetical protein